MKASTNRCLPGKIAAQMHVPGPLRLPHPVAEEAPDLMGHHVGQSEPPNPRAESTGSWWGVDLSPHVLDLSPHVRTRAQFAPQARGPRTAGSHGAPAHSRPWSCTPRRQRVQRPRPRMMRRQQRLRLQREDIQCAHRGNARLRPAARRCSAQWPAPSLAAAPTALAVVRRSPRSLCRRPRPHMVDGGRGRPSAAASSRRPSAAASIQD